jgi:predicted nucleotidyltransferase
MQEKDLKIVQKFKELVLKKVPVEEIRVFGSRAQGVATAESDLDVFIIVESLDREIEKYISECTWEAGFPEDVVVAPVVISREKLNSGNIKESVFIKRVYEEGIIV